MERAAPAPSAGARALERDGLPDDISHVRARAHFVNVIASEFHANVASRSRHRSGGRSLASASPPQSPVLTGDNANLPRMADDQPHDKAEGDQRNHLYHKPTTTSTTNQSDIIFLSHAFVTAASAW